VLGRSGKRDEAAAALEELLRLSARRYVSPHSIATVYIGLGQSTEALEWLNRAADERSNWIIFLNVDPVFDPLRDDPRFRNITDRLETETTG
jgi:predicted Zn-dependent protease